MEFRAAVKVLRKELHLTQGELAAALHINLATVSRWETGRRLPHLSTSRALLALAQEKNASAQCRKHLQESLRDCRGEALRVPESELFAVERESICQLVDDSDNAVYVADMETDTLLYANHEAERAFGKKFSGDADMLCYTFVAGRTEPCLNCPKRQMVKDYFSDAHILSERTGRRFHVRGKQIVWNGRLAHVQYLTDETMALEAQNGMKKLLDTVQVGVCIGRVYSDDRVELSYLNDGYYAMIGTTRAARQRYLAFSALQGILPADRAAATEQILAAARQKRDFDIRFAISTDGGTVKQLHTRGCFIADEAECVVYACAIMDLTDADCGKSPADALK